MAINGKKAQGLSMNVIIIAAIALLVLVILSVLILRAGSGVGTGTGCEGAGGECYSGSCSELAEERGGIWTKDLTKSGDSGGCAKDESCCIKVMGGSED